jgi:hypothetical protein
METKEIIDNLLNQSYYKVEQNLINRSEEEEFDAVCNRFIKMFSLPNDYAYFIEKYGYIALNKDKYRLSIWGIPVLSYEFAIYSILDLPEDSNNEELFGFVGFEETLSLCNFTLHSEGLHITIYFKLKFTDVQGIYYCVRITDIVSYVWMNSDEIYFLPDFNSFLLKIPELLSKEGMQQLITAANVDFDIDSAGSYSHLRKPEEPRIDGDDLPF